MNFKLPHAFKIKAPGGGQQWNHEGPIPAESCTRREGGGGALMRKYAWLEPEKR